MFELSNAYEPVELEVIHNSEGRFYRSPEGLLLPSMTTVISKFADKTFLVEWRKRIGHEEANRISKIAAKRGTALHEIVEQYIRNEPHPMRGKMPDAKDLFHQISPELNSNLNLVFLNESCLYSKSLGVAGRVDCVGEWNGNLAVVDFKTSNKPKKDEWIENYFLQVSGYAEMFREMYGVNRKIVGVILITVVEENLCQKFEFDPDEWMDHEFFAKLRKGVLV